MGWINIPGFPLWPSGRKRFCIQLPPLEMSPSTFPTPAILAASRRRTSHGITVKSPTAAYAHTPLFAMTPAILDPRRKDVQSFLFIASITRYGAYRREFLKCGLYGAAGPQVMAGWDHHPAMLAAAGQLGSGAKRKKRQAGRRKIGHNVL